MKLRQFALSVGLIAGGAIALSAPAAQAFSFQTNYTSALSGPNASKGDILLDSVTLEDGKTISDFTLVNS